MPLASGGVSAEALFGIGAATCAILGSLGVWIGRPIRRAAEERRGFFEEMRGQPPQTALDSEGRTIVVVPGRPGIPAQVAELRTSLNDVSASMREATRLMELVAHLPEQLKTDRGELNVRLDRVTAQLNEARLLAAEAATAGSRADQRAEELQDLLEGQMTALRLENEAMRAALHELGLDTELPHPLGENSDR